MFVYSMIIFSTSIEPHNKFQVIPSSGELNHLIDVSKHKYDTINYF